MLTAECGVDIAAPIDEVWRLIVDVERYSEWNPFIVKAESNGPLVVGARMRFVIRWEDGGGTTSPELVTEVAPPRDGKALLIYRANGALAKLSAVTAKRVQSLTTGANGMTRYETHETFGGWLKGAVPLAKVQRGFDLQTAALKARAEARL